MRDEVIQVEDFQDLTAVSHHIYDAANRANKIIECESQFFVVHTLYSLYNDSV